MLRPKAHGAVEERRLVGREDRIDALRHLPEEKDRLLSRAGENAPVSPWRSQPTVSGARAGDPDERVGDAGVGAGGDRDLGGREVALEDARRRLRKPHRDRHAGAEFPVIVHRLPDEAGPVLAGAHLPDLLRPVVAGRGEDAVPPRLVGFDIDHRRSVDHVDVCEQKEPSVPYPAQPDHRDGERIRPRRRAEREDALLRQIPRDLPGNRSEDVPAGLMQPADEDQVRVRLDAEESPGVRGVDLDLGIDALDRHIAPGADGGMHESYRRELHTVYASREREVSSVGYLLVVRLWPAVGAGTVDEQVVGNHLAADGADRGLPRPFLGHFHPHPFPGEHIALCIDDLVDQIETPGSRVEERVLRIPESKRRIPLDLIAVDEDTEPVHVGGIGRPIHGDGELPDREHPEAVVAGRAVGDHLQGVGQTLRRLADGIDLLAPGRVQKFQGIVHHIDPDQKPGGRKGVEIDAAFEVLDQFRRGASGLESGLDIFPCMIQSRLHGDVVGQGRL